MIWVELGCRVTKIGCYRVFFCFFLLFKFSPIRGRIHPLILTVSQAAPQQSSSPFQLKNKDICVSVAIIQRSLGSTLIGQLGSCTRGFDGVDEWVAIGLTPADWENVEGVHMNYQLWHWLFQAYKNTFCRTSVLYIYCYFRYNVILKGFYLCL